MNNRIDAVIASVPANATAAHVMARGEHWTPDAEMPPGMQHWKAPPPTKPFFANPQDPTDKDLTGSAIGRFKVIGIIDDKGGKNRGMRWLCRCTCGDYEAKSGKAIKLALAGLSPTGTAGFRCFYCTQWEVVKNRYAKKGGKSLSSFTKPSSKFVEAKTPEAIIADKISQVAKYDDAALARLIVAELNRSGYRITRDRQQPALPVEAA